MENERPPPAPDDDRSRRIARGARCSGSDRIHYDLDTATGGVIWHSDDCEDEDWEERMETADLGRYLAIEQLLSPESFKVKQELALSLPESRSRRSLFKALAGRKPLRRFKNALHHELELREQRLGFPDQGHEALARDWLWSHGIEPQRSGPRSDA